MKHGMFRIAYWSIIAFLVLTHISACDLLKPDDEPEETGSVAGYVYSPVKSPLQGVTVTIGTSSAVTDAGGYFSLSDIAVSSNVLVNFKKAAYIGTQKIVAVTSDETTYTSCTIFQASYADLNPTVPNTITSSGAQISIPPNAFVSGGSPFMGTVRAEYMYFDPTSSVALEAFPGNFSGVQTNGTEVMFESYGFINAAFYDAANPNTVLSLATGISATITLPIPLSLQANAPLNIPMWHYNEATGEWMEEGVAARTGNTYQGSVSHFTWWNFDYPIQEQATLTGKVEIDDTAHTPVAHAQVIGIGVSYNGNTVTYSDANGNFSLIVKANAQVRVQAFKGVNSSSPTSIITTPAGTGTANIGTILMSGTGYTIKGVLVNENNEPIGGSTGSLYEVYPSPVNPIQEWISTDGTGFFSSLVISTTPGTEVSVLVKLQVEPVLVSSPLTYTIPQPGQVVNLGTIVMHPTAESGNIMGILVNENNEPITEPLSWMFEFNYDLASGDPFIEEISTDFTGFFSISATSTDPGSLVNVLVKVFPEFYSSPITFTIPQPGQFVNLGTIVMHNPARIIGHAVDIDGNALSDGAQLWFRQYYNNNEYIGMGGFIGSEGAFEVYGPPNVTLTGMVGDVWTMGEHYITEPMDLSLPNSGYGNDIGVVTFMLGK